MTLLINHSAKTVPCRNRAITRVGFAVLALLILSFAYELPLVNLTGKDRLNPRLFDVAAVVLTVYWLLVGRHLGWRIKIQHPIVQLWLWITLAFGLAALLSIIWIPYDIYLFTVFYFVKYLICLLVVLIFSAIPFDADNKRKLCWVIMVGGAWTSVVAMLQFFGVVDRTRLLPGGGEIALAWYGVFSTLGVTYWHLGMYSLLCFVVAVALFFTEGNVLRRVVLLALAALFIFSIVVCGSRAAFIALAVAMVVLTVRKGFKNIALGIIIVSLGMGLAQHFYEQSSTKVRFGQNIVNTIEGRMWVGPNTLLQAYEYHGPKLLLTGGGFYVVPLPDQRRAVRYRKGYGNHNIFLFPLEQAGLIPFMLALFMWYKLLKLLRRFSTERTLPKFSRELATSINSYLVAMLLVGIAGQVFWFGFGTENFTVLQVIMFIFASTAPVDRPNNSLPDNSRGVQRS